MLSEGCGPIRARRCFNNVFSPFVFLGGRVTADQQADIEKRFTYHPPKGNQLQRYETMRSEFRYMAEHIVNTTPVSREQSLALTALEQAQFWANAAIARNE